MLENYISSQLQGRVNITFYHGATPLLFGNVVRQ